MSELLEHVIATADELGDPLFSARVRQAVGLYLAEQGAVQGIEHLREARDIFLAQRFHDEDAGRCALAMAHFVSDAGATLAARDLYAEALGDFERAHAVRGVAAAHLGAGVVAYKDGLLADALTEVRIARSHYVETRDDASVAHCDEVIARVLGSGPQAGACLLCERPIFIGDTFSSCRRDGCDLFERQLCLACGHQHDLEHTDAAQAFAFASASGDVAFRRAAGARKGRIAESPEALRSFDGNAFATVDAEWARIPRAREMAAIPSGARWAFFCGGGCGWVRGTPYAAREGTRVVRACTVCASVLDTELA